LGRGAEKGNRTKKKRGNEKGTEGRKEARSGIICSPKGVKIQSSNPRDTPNAFAKGNNGARRGKMLEDSRN